MHQPRVNLAAGDGQVSHCQPVHQECGQRLFLGHVHLVVGGGVEEGVALMLDKLHEYVKTGWQDLFLVAGGVMPKMVIEVPEELRKWEGR